jgi:L-lactate dehydrogenase complex protein LldG
MRLPAALAPKLFVVVDSGQLLASLDEFFTDSFGNTDASNLFLITGPSRTADIEKQLVKGVHGPKEIVVLFINQ